jgi:homoserine dehydrogenase
MQSLQIIQLGLGGVGQALIRQHLTLAERHPWLTYAALGDRSGLLTVDGGFTRSDLQTVLDAKSAAQPLSQIARHLDERAHFHPNPTSGLPSLTHILDNSGTTQYVVADLTAERHAYGTLLQARQNGAHIVMCNKWTLAESTERYEAFMQAGTGRVLYESTVGAALPVIGTLDRLLETGDDVQRIEAAISGTLGFVCTEIQRGVPFSQALREASRLRYTEPDPRDDLAGIDARRKALILARKVGHRLNMDDVRVQSLVPPYLESVSIEEFWQRLPEADREYAARVAEAASRGNVLRFLAAIDATGASVILTETPLSSPAGSLTGTESLFVFHTRRYGDQPLAVHGRGAGADLTASGVLSDILSLKQDEG